MKTLLQDLRFALRLQLRSPAFFAIVALTLTLGIGATIAIFTIVNGVLLQPLDYPRPETLVEVYEENPARGMDFFSVSPANYSDWRRQNQVFESLGAYDLYSKNSFTLTSGEQPEPITSVGVTGDFFGVFGVRPLHGRTFLPEEDRPGADHVVVLAHGFWQRRFGGDPAIVGQTLELDRQAYEVVGVMPESFRYPASVNVDLWVPLALSPEIWQSRTIRTLFVPARLKPGVTLEQARQEMRTIAARLQEAYPATNQGFTAGVYSLHERMVANARSTLLVLTGAVLLVLLIACVNVANLLVARGTVRQRELALRQAVGADRPRLLRQLITEGVVLAAAGGVLGLAFAQILVRLIVNRLGAFLPRVSEIAIDAKVMVFALLLALLTGIVFSLAPALQVLLSMHLSEVLREGGRSGSSGASQAWLRRSLVMVEVGLALVLLIAAGLMLRSFDQLQAVEPGFDSQRVLSFQVTLPGSQYAEPARQRNFVREMTERLSGATGIENIAVVNRLPLSSLPYPWDFFEVGSPPKSLDDVKLSEFRAISADYLEAMDIPLVAGRSFSTQDREDGVPVLLINEAMRRQFWPDQEVLGKRLVIGQLVSELLPGLPLEVEIVGVVGSARQFQLSQEPVPLMYLPFGQYPSTTFFVVAETLGAPRGSLAAIEREIRALDRFVPLMDVRLMEERLQASVAGTRLAIYLLGGFAAVALFLAAVGIYGVMSYSVAQRTKEMGIRTALGAEPGGLIKLVVGQGLRLAAYGLALGLMLAALASGLIRSLLFGVSSFDPLTFVLSVVVLATVAALACLLPALRASRVDPMVALRSE